MKLFWFILTITSVLFITTACTDKATIKSAEPVALVRLADALKGGTLGLATDASMLHVRVIKDAGVVVNAMLNYLAGNLVVAPGASSFTTTIDMTSFNSQLLMRDQRVAQIFFGVEDDANKIAQFIVVQLPADVVSKLQTQSRLDNVSLDGELKFHGATLPVTAVVTIQKKDERLIVDSVSPIVIKISALGMSAPLKNLMAICGHNNVEDDVQITIHAEFVGLK